MSNWLPWLCCCCLQPGLTHTTQWLTQDGADECAAETEAQARRDGGRAVCVVVPNEYAAARADAEARANDQLVLPDEDAGDE